MKNITSAYGIVAVLSFVVSSVLSYLWGTLGGAAYAVVALTAAGVFVLSVAKNIDLVTEQECATITTVDFTPVNMNKAA